MEVGGFEGENFHHPLEPMVIINSQDEEEDNFFRKLHLRRKSSLKSNQISTADQFRNHLGFLRSEFKSETANNKTAEITFRPVKIDRKKSKIEEACQPYVKRQSSPLEQCPICKKYFRRMKTHLLKHKIVENQNALICQICTKVFHTQNNLHIHMRSHTGEKRYACTVCGKCFTQSCNLVNHVRIHTGEKPYKCPHCERAFTQSGNLNNHIRLHTDEKPFKCHFCDKAFVQSGNLNSHIRNNHRVN